MVAYCFPVFIMNVPCVCIQKLSPWHYFFSKELAQQQKAPYPVTQSLCSQCFLLGGWPCITQVSILCSKNARISVFHSQQIMVYSITPVYIQVMNRKLEVSADELCRIYLALLPSHWKWQNPDTNNKVKAGVPISLKVPFLISLHLFTKISFLSTHICPESRCTFSANKNRN